MIQNEVKTTISQVKVFGTEEISKLIFIKRYFIEASKLGDVIL